MKFSIISVLIITTNVLDQILAESEDSDDKPETCTPTTPDVLGPYYYPNPPFRRILCGGERSLKNSQHLLVEGRILDENCNPLTGAKIEVWQADHNGHYLFKDQCSGYFVAGKGGHYALLTIHPGKYSTDPDGKLLRPAHLHFRVKKEGYNILVTQMYFNGDKNLGDRDSCTECSSGHPDLVVEPEEVCADGSDMYCFTIAHFDIVLKRGNSISVVKDIDDNSVELEDAVLAGK